MTGWLEKIEIREREVGKAVFTKVPLREGEAVLPLSGREVDRPSRYTLQLGNGRHMLPEGKQWGFINHSCEPNCCIDFSSLSVRTLRPIAVGEEITFNYLTTEWDMASPFECQCGEPGCFGAISGYRHLTLAERKRLRAIVGVVFHPEGNRADSPGHATVGSGNEGAGFPAVHLEMPLAR
ncbi:MAG: SET domain-containing protein [Magnetococcales bacterium]|nr:SET domain-containing protein [Magnetococcales bacterium]MBF0323087.1 SET domain-containing protein [Magnetococcales bacterium]